MLINKPGLPDCMLMRSPRLTSVGALKCERVNIQSGKAGLLISAPGVAIMDGIKGQQIPVKNVSSQRVIHATVTAPGQVTVTF